MLCEFDVVFVVHTVRFADFFSTQDGLLEVTPSFSGVVDELQAHGEAVEESMPLSLFMNDETAEASIKKGVRLSTFRVKARNGSEYEYVIQNVNDVMIPFKIEEYLRQQANIDAMKAAETRYGESDSWKQDPSSRTRTVAIYAEIVGTSGFEGYRHFVSYHVKHSASWSLRSGNVTDGVENEVIDDGVDGDGRSGVHSFHEDASSKSSLLAHHKIGMMSGTTAVSHVIDGYHRMTRLQLLRPKWRGIVSRLAFSKSTRYFVGLLFFVVTGTAVVVGVNYPFWIVPALVIWFIVGTGVPASEDCDVVLLDNAVRAGGLRRMQQGGRHRSHASAHNPLGRHLAENREIASSWSTCNHLFSVAFDVSDDDQVPLNTAPSSKVPVVIFKVYSKDSYGRMKLQGYGYYNIPDKPGCEEVEIKTWRPIAGISLQLQDFFLGSAATLKDDSLVENAFKTNTTLNKFGMVTESSGSIRFRCQTIETDARRAAVASLDVGAGGIGLGSTESTARVGGVFGSTSVAGSAALTSSADVKRSVQDILQSFQLGKKPSGASVSSSMDSSARRSLDPSTGNAPKSAAAAASGSGADGAQKPSVNSILQALNANSTASRVADILARSRAKVSAVSSLAQVTTQRAATLPTDNEDAPLLQQPQPRGEGSAETDKRSSAVGVASDAPKPKAAGATNKIPPSTHPPSQQQQQRSEPRVSDSESAPLLSRTADASDHHDEDNNPADGANEESGGDAGGTGVAAVVGGPGIPKTSASPRATSSSSSSAVKKLRKLSGAGAAPRDTDAAGAASSSGVAAGLVAAAPPTSEPPATAVSAAAALARDPALENKLGGRRPSGGLAPIADPKADK